MNIEALELRIAPASVLTYIDIDGDKVRVTSTSATGDLNAGGVALFSDADPTHPRALWQLTLGAAFAGTNLTFSVSKVPGGDGLADVGHIEATLTDLGSVTVKGDLGQIDAGDGDPANGPALKTLKVRSMGRFGTATQGGVGDLESNFEGALNSLQIRGDLVGADVFVNDDADLLSVRIGGSLIGSTTAAGNGGTIYAEGNLGSVFVGRDVIGGSFAYYGSIGAGYNVKSITVGGSVIGGAAANAGFLFAGYDAPPTENADMGPVKIGRDLIGGSALDTGTIAVLKGDGKLVSVIIGRSVIGGSAEFSGAIRAGDPPTIGDFTIGSITIGGSLLGGGGVRSGYISTDDALGIVKIGRDVIGGAGQESGRIDGFSATTAGVSVGGSMIRGAGSLSGAIAVGNITGKISVARSIINGSIQASSGAIFLGGDLVGGSIGFGGLKSLTIAGSVISSATSGVFIGGNAIDSLTVKGSIIGSEAVPVIVDLTGKSSDQPGFALGKLSVGGRVEWARIGTSTLFSPLNGQIGTVKVGGDWIASSISSGVGAGGDGFYGTGDDFLAAAILEHSRIAAILIGGAIVGSGTTGDSFAFTAHEIGSFKALGKTFPLTASVIDPTILFSPATSGDVKLREL